MARMSDAQANVTRKVYEKQCWCSEHSLALRVIRRGNWYSPMTDAGVYAPRKKRFAWLDDRWLRATSFEACVKHGWVELDDLFPVQLGKATAVYGSSVASVTDAGHDAYAAWQRDKFANPKPVEALNATDADVLMVAVGCVQLGYAMVPVTDAAKKQARRLGRTVYAKRGFVGSSTSSLLATDTGMVEVFPDHADRPA